MKLFYVYLSPGSCHLLSLKSKHSPQHPFNKDPHYIRLSIFFNIMLEFTTILSFKNCLWFNQPNTLDNAQNTSQSYCNIQQQNPSVLLSSTPFPTVKT
jgi:hypothetical protein